MLGAIIGDIVGSRFEFNNNRSKNFELFNYDCEITDDSIMTLAIGLAIVKSEKNIEVLPSVVVDSMRVLGQAYPFFGYGARFCEWLGSKNPQPYGSYGNGAAMRVSACGFMAETLEEAKALSNAVTKVTHNHPEGLKGAEATAIAVFLAKSGKDKEEIKKHITDNYYKIDFTLDSIRKTYEFNESCQGTVPVALEAFFESDSFEDAIRNAISVGGDSDTIAAITGSVAEAYFEIPEALIFKAFEFLDEDLKAIYEKCKKYCK